MNLDALYSTIDILKYLGAICNDTSILDDKKNRLNPLKDLELNKMHKIIYTAVENIYLNNGVKEVDEISINMFLSGYPDQHGYYTQNKGDELVQKIKAGNKACAYEMSLGTIKKFSLLREYEKVGFSTKDIYNTNLIDPIEISAQRMKFDQMSENDIIAQYVREKHPEILTSVDFGLYKFSLAWRNMVNDLKEAFKNIDFSKLAERVNGSEDNEQ